MELPRAIIAILFYQAEPTTLKRLAGYLKTSEGAVRDALPVVEDRLADTGLCLIKNGDELTLGTETGASALIAEITKEELSRELSKASLETLAIVLYKGPVTRSEIDYIRGVNSTFILRNLLIRGLVEKIENPHDQRSFLYKPSFQLLEHMGVTEIGALPDYASTMATLSSFVLEKEAELAEAKVENTSAPEGSGEGATGENLDLSTDDEIDADVSEENDMGESYDDDELREHDDEARGIAI